MDTNGLKNNYVNQQATTKAINEKPKAELKKVSGRTIGDPQLSEKALKYYEQLKKKFSNMDFILVSPEMKEEAERNKGMYSSSKELLVLIDSDKIEKMTEDENYRQKYETILTNATSKVLQMKNSLGPRADSVRSFGMTFDDNGNASFFAVIDKSLKEQRERIEANHEKKIKEQKVKEQKAEKNESEKKEADNVIVSAASWDELLKKIDDTIMAGRSDYVRTENEKKIGQTIDYSL